MSLLSAGRIADNILKLLHVFARIPFTRIIQVSLKIHVDKVNIMFFLKGDCIIYFSVGQLQTYFLLSP
jgi:hypothetical protein